MKMLIAIALTVTSMPAIAAVSAAGEADVQRERKVCTQATPRGGSRMSQRVCLTPTQWRERLGSDWRQRMSGNTDPEGDFDAVETVSRVHSTLPTDGLSGGGPR